MVQWRRRYRALKFAVGERQTTEHRICFTPLRLAPRHKQVLAPVAPPVVATHQYLHGLADGPVACAGCRMGFVRAQCFAGAMTLDELTQAPAEFVLQTAFNWLGNNLQESWIGELTTTRVAALLLALD
jgi:hypothetical protein